MIKARNIQKKYRHQYKHVHVDISTDSDNFVAFILSRETQAQINSVKVLYSVATDATEIAYRDVQVGTIADPNAHVQYTIAVSQAAGTIVACTLLTTGLIAANTPVTVSTATGADTNPGEIDIIIEYDLV